MQLVLPSDMSRAMYPANKANHFRGQLIEPITAYKDQRYEVALTEAIVPSKLDYNKADMNLWVQIFIWDRTKFSKQYHMPGIH